MNESIATAGLSFASEKSDFSDIKFPNALRENFGFEYKCVGGTANDTEAPLFPEEYKVDLPFRAAVKNDRIGRIADWRGPSYFNDKRSGARNQEEIDNSWNVSSVENKTTGSKKGKGRERRNYGSSQRGTVMRRSWITDKRKNQAYLKPSITIEPSWKLVEEIEFNRLSKLQLSHQPASHLDTPTLEKIPVVDGDIVKTIELKEAVHLEHFKVQEKYTSMTEDDHLIQNIIKKNPEANILISDTAAALLMSCTKTVIPWDLSIKRKGDLVIIEQRSDDHLISMPTINENDFDYSITDPSNINSSQSLSQESELLKNSTCALISSHKTFVNSKRYSLLDLGEESKLIVRGSAHLKKNDNDVCLVSPLLEYEENSSKNSISWRQKLKSQRGAIFAQEIKKNNVHLAKTVFSAIVNSIPTLYLAFVSRKKFKENSQHDIFSCQNFEPLELASQMNLNVENGFGMLRALVDLCKNLPDDRDYVLMRDPIKPSLLLYKIIDGDDIDILDELMPAMSSLKIPMQFQSS